MQFSLIIAQWVPLILAVMLCHFSLSFCQIVVQTVKSPIFAQWIVFEHCTVSFLHQTFVVFPGKNLLLFSQTAAPIWSIHELYSVSFFEQRNFSDSTMLSLYFVADFPIFEQWYIPVPFLRIFQINFCLILAWTEKFLTQISVFHHVIVSPHFSSFVSRFLFHQQGSLNPQCLEQQSWNTSLQRKSACPHVLTAVRRIRRWSAFEFEFKFEVWFRAQTIQYFNYTFLLLIP